MAVIDMHVASNELKMNTNINIIVPDIGTVSADGLKNTKVLWLLHGLSDDASAWLRFTRIEEYAREYGLVVIMPNAGRSMYCDDCLGQNYFTHISKELPEYFSRILGISTKKENNFIAGLSMGGMGAMKIALTFPENYFAAASFSGLLDLSICSYFKPEKVQHEFPFMTEGMKDPEHSSINPAALINAKKDRDIKLYVSCGVQDSLCDMSRSFIEKATNLGIDVSVDFPQGTHEWRLWDLQIKRFLDLVLGKLY